MCSAGPRISASKFYTCGHVLANEYNRQQDVYVANGLMSVNVGYTTNYVYGSQGDSCQVSTSARYLPSENTFMSGTGIYSYPNYAPEVYTEVEMHGAASGLVCGTITAVNMTVNVEGVIVGNLSQATYDCRLGDSGGGVFSAGALTDSDGICYGIQSNATDWDGEKFTVSLFTQLY